MSKSSVVVLSIVLLTGISFVPALQIGVNGQVQQQQQPQQNQVGLSQIIKQIAQQVVTANPDTNATHVQQILVQLAKQTAQTASKEQAFEEIRQIYSQVSIYPFGTVSQSLSHFAQQLASGANVASIIERISQEKVSSGGNISQSLVNKANQTATGANTNNINQHIRQTAQLISKQTGVSVEKVEAIIIQMALQIAQLQGKDITGQFIFQLANHIARNPTGTFTQLLLQLVKQDTDATEVQQILEQLAQRTDQEIVLMLQPSNTLLTQISPFIQAITNNITSHNPDTHPKPDPDKIKQLLQGIGMETGEISETRAIQAMSEIAAEVDVDPKGPLAQTLIALSQQTEAGDGAPVDVVNLIQQDLVSGESVSDSIINAATSLILEIAMEERPPSVSTAELENILEAIPSVDINSEINASLKVEPSSVSIEENTPTTVVVSGTLTYINNSGINDEVISISIGTPGQEIYEYKRNAHTDDKGIYEVDFDDVRLSKGTYEIVARPASDNYSELSASTQFSVESHPLSFNDIFPYLAASGIIIGIVSVIPRWYIRKRERNNLTQYMIKIHDEYNKFSKSKEIDYLNHLSGLRVELIQILKEGKINEAQYEMLDRKFQIMSIESVKMYTNLQNNFRQLG